MYLITVTPQIKHK